MTTIDTLSAAPAATLESLWKALGITPEYRLVRGPETGLVMIRGRAICGSSSDARRIGPATRCGK